MQRGGEITVSVGVENSGDGAGGRSGATRETNTVRVKLKANTLSYWDERAGRFVVEEERVRILVGGSLADTLPETIVTVAR